MDIILYFSEHHDKLLYLIAGISFVVELTILGMSGPLLFFAIATFITGLLVSAGIISGWEAEVFTVGLLTAIVAATLWAPFKRFQNSGGQPDSSSDMIGLNVPASSPITAYGGSIRYSGIDWNARLHPSCTEETLAADSRCVIAGVDGNIMLVTAPQ